MDMSVMKGEGMRNYMEITVFWEENEAGERVLDFSLSYDLAVINTYFRKREEHYITYKSGDNR